MLPIVVVQDEWRAGLLVTVGHSTAMRERFYCISTRNRRRSDVLGPLQGSTPAWTVSDQKSMVRLASAGRTIARCARFCDARGSVADKQFLRLL